VQRRQRAGGRDFEDRPTASAAGTVSATARCSVEVPIGGLDQPCDGIGAVRVVKAVQRGQRACRCDFEDRATGAIGTVLVSPASVRRPVEVPVGGLDQPCVGIGAVDQVKAVQCRQRARGRDFENRPTASDCGASSSHVAGVARCSVQGPVGALDQRASGRFTVRATVLGTKIVKRRQRAAWGDFEERPAAIIGAAIEAGVGSALRSRPVEVPVAGLDQGGSGESAAREWAKIVQRRERATWCDF